MSHLDRYQCRAGFGEFRPNIPSCCSASSTTWLPAHRTLSQQERSPDQFGAVFRTLPTTTPGYLHPSPPVSGRTIPPRVPPHTKVLNSTHQQGSAGSNGQGTYLTSTPSSSPQRCEYFRFLPTFPSWPGWMWTNVPSGLFTPSEQRGVETGSAVESLTDADSIKGLGDTGDFLNMVRDGWVWSESAGQILFLTFKSSW